MLRLVGYKMSERLSSSPERAADNDAELKKRQAEVLKELHEKAAETRHEHAEKLEDIRESAEKAAESAEEVKKSFEKPRDDEEKLLHISADLKKVAYRRTLKRTRERLPAYERPFSAFVHHPVVEAISEFGARTVARPSGVFAGGLTAFLGTSLFLWIARHYGYEYNFLLFALLFVAGFFVGLVIELALRLLARKRT